MMNDDRPSWLTPSLTTLSVTLDTAFGINSQSDGSTGTGVTPN